MPHECPVCGLAEARFYRDISATAALVDAFLKCDRGWLLGRQMRLIPLFCALLLVTGPAFSQQQQLALTPAKPDCPPGEPDSLQISWTQPCDSGEWLLDTESGCRMWDWHPEPEDQVVWKGACRAGQADGEGQAQWFEHGHPIDRFAGTYRNGKREGPGEYRWNDTVSFSGSYANDVPQGHGTVRIGDVKLSGEWTNGCLSQDGKTVAIGVPRVSCAAPAKPKPRTADR